MSTHRFGGCHPFFWVLAGAMFAGGGSQAVESPLLDPVAAKKMIDRVEASGETVRVIDVRAHAEHRRAHIPGAVNISIREEKDLAGELQKRNIGKDSILLIYSGSGTRSGRMVVALKEAGFPRAWGLDKGLRAWEAEGFGIERGAGEP